MRRGNDTGTKMRSNTSRIWASRLVLLLILVAALAYSARLLQGAGLASEAGMEAETSVSAVLTGVGGDVEVYLPREKAWRTVGSGFPLGPGDRVRTGKDSWAEIKLVLGSMPRGWIRIEPETEFLIDRATPGGDAQTSGAAQAGSRRQVVLRTRLFLGRVYIKILRALAPVLGPALDFETVTDAATVGVRGTLFSAYVLPSVVTGVSVQEGLVEVTAQGESVLIKSGHETAISPGMPPRAPAAMSAAERKMWRKVEKWINSVKEEIEEIKKVKKGTGKGKDTTGNGSKNELQGPEVPDEHSGSQGSQSEDPQEEGLEGGSPQNEGSHKGNKGRNAGG